MQRWERQSGEVTRLARRELSRLFKEGGIKGDLSSEKHIKPRLKSECERLAIPQSFIPGIYRVYPEPFVCSSYCELIKQDEEIKALKIRTDSEIRSPQIAIMHFWHELRHTKDCYENRKSTEWRAHPYVLRRHLEQLVRPISLRLTQKTNLPKVWDS